MGCPRMLCSVLMWSKYLIHLFAVAGLTSAIWKTSSAFPFLHVIQSWRSFPNSKVYRSRSLLSVLNRFLKSSSCRWTFIVLFKVVRERETVLAELLCKTEMKKFLAVVPRKFNLLGPGPSECYLISWRCQQISSKNSLFFLIRIHACFLSLQ